MGQPAFVRAYGDASMEAGVPAQPDTVYSLAFFDQAVHCGCCPAARRAGLIDLDAPISRYLPDWQQPVLACDNRSITRAAVQLHAVVRAECGFIGRNHPDTLIDLFADAPLDFPPGTQFSCQRFRLRFYRQIDRNRQRSILS